MITKKSSVGDAPRVAAEIVIAAEALVIATPAPAVNVALVKPVPLPMNSWPLVPVSSLAAVMPASLTLIAPELR